MVEVRRVSPITSGDIVTLKQIASAVFGPVPDAEIDGVLENRTDFCLHFAHEGERIVGFKMGYRQDRESFYSWLGGVLPDCRGRGIARALMNAQHEWCRSVGFKRVETRTKNKFRDMLILNLRSGFDIIGAYTDEKREPKLILEKTL